MSESIAIFLNDFRDGKSLQELTKALEHVIAAVRTTGQAGSFTWKLTIKPASKTDADKVTIADSITEALPKPGRSEDFFFVTEDNATSRKHPRQRELELRSVGDDRPMTFKEVSNDR